MSKDPILKALMQRAKRGEIEEVPLSSTAAREWWIVEGVFPARLFENEDEAIRAAGWSAEQEPTFNFHVIERSALTECERVIEAQKNEIDRLLEHYNELLSVRAELRIRERKLEIAVRALEVYATNETFPEYGDTARATLAQIKKGRAEK